jgi:hypothetical protein
VNVNLEPEKQYGHLLAEYRFQVLLNWDRTKHYFTFNTVLFGAAVALYKEAMTWPAKAGIAALLLLASLNSFHGAFAVGRGHQYYRNIRQTKAEIEEKLGLYSLAIQSTPGMQRDADLTAEGIPVTGPRRFWSITTQARWILRLIGASAALGALYAAYASCIAFRAS